MGETDRAILATIPSCAGEGMTIVLPALAVAFAAFCVWLAVRIVNRRERWAKWTLAALIVLIAVYPLSWGPRCWLYYWGFISDDLMPVILTIHAPLDWLAINGPKAVQDAMSWYWNLGIGID